MDELAKNLWILLTLVVPGMTTYGSFRLLLALGGAKSDKGMFDKLDGSALLTSCAIVALAVAQQAVAISIEAGASHICWKLRHKYRRYYLLFCERFKMAARGELNEGATRIVANLFTSLNVTIGQCMVLLYLVLHEKLSLSDGATGVIAVFVVAGSIDTLFRMADAASIVNAVRAGAPHAKSEAAAPAPGPED
jgi:hypothetical protein